MIKILFLCTGNSCRSQMAEGWCNHFHKGRARAFSAGTEPEGEVTPPPLFSDHTKYGKFGNRIISAFMPKYEKRGGGVSKYAIQAMREAGIDISTHRSKHLDEFKDIKFDAVITVCDNARERCPLYWGQAKKIHKSFEDPFVLAKNSKSGEEALNHYRRIRDELKEFVVNILKAI